MTKRTNAEKAAAFSRLREGYLDHALQLAMIWPSIVGFVGRPGASALRDSELMILTALIGRFTEATGGEYGLSKMRLVHSYLKTQMPYDGVPQIGMFSAPGKRERERLADWTTNLSDIRVERAALQKVKGASEVQAVEEKVVRKVEPLIYFGLVQSHKPQGGMVWYRTTDLYNSWLKCAITGQWPEGVTQ